jgi:hypothetical protein
LSARIRTALTAGAAVVVSACVSAPSGQYRFALDADKAHAVQVWALTSLPRHGRIDLAAHTNEETNPRQSTHVMLRFGESSASFPVAALDMDDPGCQGAYSFSFEYSKRSLLSQTEYFDSKLPWAAPLKVRIEWWPDGHFEIEIVNVGRRTLEWRGPATRFEIRLLAGSLQVDELDYHNLSSS